MVANNGRIIAKDVGEFVLFFSIYPPKLLLLLLTYHASLPFLSHQFGFTFYVAELSTR